MSPTSGSDPDLTHWQGEPVGVWEALWGVPRFEAWSAVGSTNDRARDLALEGASPWTTVVARHQHRGRGRSGRSWQSDRGAGLWVSFLLQSRAKAQAHLVPLLAGIALARTLEAAPGVGERPTGAPLRTDVPADEPRGHAALKWPNDVWWSGRKISGILCESVGPRIVVGVGVNLRVPDGGFAAAHAPTAGALEDLTGRSWSESWLLGRLIRELRGLWEPPRLRLEADLLAAWNARDLLKDRRVRVGGVTGHARGISSDGALNVETDTGEVCPVRAGHVEWGDEMITPNDHDAAEE